MAFVGFGQFADGEKERFHALLAEKLLSEPAH
jgi:hypothetical protein